MIEGLIDYGLALVVTRDIYGVMAEVIGEKIEFIISNSKCPLLDLLLHLRCFSPWSARLL